MPPCLEPPAVYNLTPAVPSHLIVGLDYASVRVHAATAAQHYGMRTVAVEPENCRALNAALEADQVVDVTVESIAADALGARRVSEMALNAARSETVRSLLVSDAEIIVARQALWDHHRLAVEHGAATAPRRTSQSRWLPSRRR